MSHIAWSYPIPTTPAPLAPCLACGQPSALILCKRCGGALSRAEQAQMASVKR